MLPSEAQEGRVRGPRIGYNAAGHIYGLLDPDRHAYSVSVDYEVLQDLYPILEFGWQKVEISTDRFQYGSEGVIMLIGADKNMFKYTNPRDYDMGFAGIRYGMSFLWHSASDINISEAYLGDLIGGDIPTEKIVTSWLSAGGGLRVEVFHNFFIGWSAFGNIRIAQTSDTLLEAYHVPGFGQGSRRVSLNINFSLFYRIPVSRFE